MKLKIIRISNTGNVWNGVEMSVNDFNKLLSVLDLSRYQHTITFENNGYQKTIVLNEVRYSIRKELENDIWINWNY